MFEGAELDRIDRDEATVRVRHGGSGRPPLLLLHGHPQTHVMCHAVAPKLAEEFTVVATPSCVPSSRNETETESEIVAQSHKVPGKPIRLHQADAGPVIGTLWLRATKFAL